MTKKLFSVISTLLIIAFAVNGEILFQDDFSKEAESSLKWTSLNPNEFESKFTNGGVEIKNASSTASNAIYCKTGKSFDAFTLSAEVTFVGDGQHVGLAFCMPTDLNSGSFYTFLIKSNGDYMCGKLGTSISVKYSSYITTTKNVLKVSKKGTNINLFVNGKFLEAVSAETSGPNIGLFVNPQTNVIFDNVVLTDVYETGANPSTFEDKFEDGMSNGWSGNKHMNDGVIEEKNGKLRISTMAIDENYSSSIRTSVNTGDNFVMKAEFSHKAGDTLKPYGLSLWGENDDQRINFCVVASRAYGTSVGYVSFELTPNSSVKGKAYVSSTLDTTYYVDVLEVVKKSGENKFLFVINKDTVKTVDGGNFKIAQVGIELSPKVDVEIDNFSIKPLINSFVSWKRPDNNRPKITRNSNAVVFDIMGRNAGRMADLSNRQLNRATGIYVNKDFKGRIVLKK